MTDVNARNDVEPEKIYWLRDGLNDTAEAGGMIRVKEVSGDKVYGIVLTRSGNVAICDDYTELQVHLRDIGDRVALDEFLRRFRVVYDSVICKKLTEKDDKPTLNNFADFFALNSQLRD